MNADQEKLFIQLFPFSAAAMSGYNTFLTKMRPGENVLSTTFLRDGREFSAIGFGVTAFVDAPGAVLVHGSDPSGEAMSVRDADIACVRFGLFADPPAEEPSPFGFHPRR